MSAFRNWFKEQYGALPNDRKLHALRRKHDDLLGALHDAKRMMEYQERLHVQFNDALLGWNAGQFAANSQESK